MHKIGKKKSGINEQDDEKIIDTYTSEIKLIPNAKKGKDISFLKLAFILSYWVFINHITMILGSLMIFDYWIFELLFICLLTSKLLKTEIYTHQKLGIIINSISCFILGVIKFIII